MGPFGTYSAGTWNNVAYSVDSVSNSTLSYFNFNQPEKLISFDVTGANGTAGFCRATIPNALLGSPYAILVDGVQPTVLNQISNRTCTFLYFTYGHSARHVTIVGATAVPEFPSFVIFPLLLASILLAALISAGIMSRNGGVSRKEDEK